MTLKLGAQQIPDTLRLKSFAYLADQIDREPQDSLRRSVYCRAYLQKAKAENNSLEIFNAYKAILHQVAKDNRLKYADSLVLTARRIGKDALIGSAYLTRGIIFYDQKRHKDALDNYLIADEFIAHSGDEYLKHKVKFNIAQIKSYLGFYQDALALLKDCVDYYELEGGRPYLNSLHALGLCYQSIGQYELATATNELGLREAIKEGETVMTYYFAHSEGINQYRLKHYSNAIAKLDGSLKGIARTGDFANAVVANYYIGKCYWDLNDHERSLPYLQNVDDAFSARQYLRPDLRGAFEMLIDYYTDKNDQDRQLYYIKRLLLAEVFLDKNYKYLSQKIYKQYDTKALLAKQHAIESSMRRQQLWINLFKVAMAVMAATAGLLWYRSRSRNPHRRNQIKPTGATAIQRDDINPEIVDSVLKYLEKFEKGNKYLEKGITLETLSKWANSNSKYVSRIIALHRNLRPSDYINMLRVEYIKRNLQSNPRLHQYTLKALADEAGFSTPRQLNAAFLKHEGTSVTGYVEKLSHEVVMN